MSLLERFPEKALVVSGEGEVLIVEEPGDVAGGTCPGEYCNQLLQAFLPQAYSSQRRSQSTVMSRRSFGSFISFSG